MSIKKKDFVELEYTGKLKEEGIVFDTTNEKIAKEHNIFSEQAVYGAMIICVGEGHVLKGIDKSLEGKDTGKYTVELKPEGAFGKKNAKLIKLISTQKFKDQKINPVPGLQVNIDGIIGTIRSVSGGRTLIDFNHPLSGKELIYEINIKRVVGNEQEKVKSILKNLLGIKDVEVKIENEKALIIFEKALPEQTQKKLEDTIKELTKINEVEWGSGKETDFKQQKA